MAMPEWLYEAGPHGLWIFLLLTLLLGGAAAWATGKAIAVTWRPFWHIPAYTSLLALGVRFLHFALFEEPFVAPSSLLVDYAVLLGIAVLGYTVARNRALHTQYDWLYEPAGWIGVRRRKLVGNPESHRDSG